MVLESHNRSPPLQTSLPINFLIIGGGNAGLACALALRRVGHHALVLERRDRNSSRGEGGICLPPNLTKILFHWGLGDALQDKGLISHTVKWMRYESGECLGQHAWGQELLKETQGVFMLITHGELHDILYEAATRAGVRVRFNAEVVSVDPRLGEVELTTGETLTGDVLVGADGEYGPCRTVVAGKEIRGHATGLVMYDTTLPGEYVPPHLESLLRDNGTVVAYGERRAIVAYPVHGGQDFVFRFFGFESDGDSEGSRWSLSTRGTHPSSLYTSSTPDDALSLKDVVQHVRNVVRVTVREHDDMPDWVKGGCRLVLIGEAAHPYPPGTVQATAMGVEDGAVLAKLFSHLSEERQILSFLYAYEELRQSRVRHVRAGEWVNSSFIILTGESAAQRDASLRAKAAASANLLEGDEMNALKEEILTVFGYDCEDVADDWWVKWGRLQEHAISLRERSHEGEGLSQTPLDLSAMAV
ncbi:FAD/NAD-P-binding domain-containing protein [Trametes punicea]|nr:FAD/NAD-P-binding domain-containing protein [Trametes punicea]